MPVVKVKGGFRWGKHGHVYPTRAGAERQARAAYAHGYRGDGKVRLRMALDARYDARDPEPYMVLDRPDGFSCAQCIYLRPEGREYHCANVRYQAHYGESLLRGPDRMPLSDPRLACSNWFFPTQ